MKTLEKSQIDPSIATSTLASYQEEKGEAYMNPRQRAHFQALLLQLKNSYQERSEQMLNQLQDEATVSPDVSDQASQEEAFGIKLRTHGREHQLIKKIDEALHALTMKDSYGYCEACGGNIGIQRLEARPTATLCIDCKTLDEIREKQQGS